MIRTRPALPLANAHSFVRMPGAAQRQRPQPTSAPDAFGLWTREPRAGVVLRLAGLSNDSITLDKVVKKRADQIVKWLDPEGKMDPKVRDAIVASVVDSRSDGRDDYVSRWLLSNQRVDSYDSTLAWDGWQLGDFRRNPVVLLAHDSYVDRSLPIGEDVGAYMDPLRAALMGLTRYVSQEVAGVDSLEARAVRWVKFGLLRAVSVGFEPIEWKVAEDRDEGDSWWVPVDFVKQALREYSVVPVPANPDSLADGRGWAKMSPADIDAAATDIERSLDGAGWLVLPRAQLEQMRAAVRGARIQVDVGGSSFVVARADDGVADPTDPATEDPGETMKCPACGYSGPEGEFIVGGSNQSDAGAEASDQEKAAATLLSTAALTHELHRRHASRRTVALDSPPAARDVGAEDVRVAAAAVAVLDSMDAIRNGRLP